MSFFKDHFTSTQIATTERVCEVAWFNDLCGGDTEYLGVPDPARASSFAHCRDIMTTADALGYSNILLPTSYMVGQETIPFAASMHGYTKRINTLAAIRTGEIHPVMLARHIATLDHLLEGRLTINIINSDLPGLQEEPALRYKRCEEVIQILKQAWTLRQIDFTGDVYTRFTLTTDPVKPYQKNGPMLYFGGISAGSQDLCAKYCDVFLMWPEPEDSIYKTMQQMSQQAAAYNRTLDFGLRVHVIVRETEAEARAYAKQIMSKFNPTGYNLKHQAQDSKSAGVKRQDDAREKLADADDFIEPFLWSGIGRARSGCGAAIVGNPEQVLAKINRYMDMGIRAFIFSGYPLIEESKYFAQYILPHLPNIQLNILKGKV